MKITSGGDAIEEEASRYADYLLEDSGAIKKIYDWDSFLEAVRTVWSKDPSLINLLNSIDMEELRPMYELSEIQNVLKNNQTDLYEEIEKEVVRRALDPLKKPEIDRRVSAIYEKRVGKAPDDIKKIKIKERPKKRWLRKEHVSKYFRKGKEIGAYYYTPRRDWVDSEARFLAQRLDRKPKEVIGEYRASPLAFRTTISVRNKFYRIRKEFAKESVSKDEFISKYR